jgi:hypothetical protein
VKGVQQGRKEREKRNNKEGKSRKEKDGRTRKEREGEMRGRLTSKRQIIPFAP